MKRVLVTGARGFIGRHCLPLLAALGYEIHALSRAPVPTPSAEERLTWHVLDVLSGDGAAALLHLVRPTHLLHLAWTAVPGKFWTDPDNARWAAESERLVHAFAAAGGKHLVVAGSCAEYDWGFARCVEDETPISPATPYGVAKHSLHESLVPLTTASGLSLCWGRIFWLYGPHEHPLRFASSAALAMLAGQPFECRNPDQVRDFLHVEDAARAFVSLLDSESAGAFNIASGEGVTLRSLVSEIAHHVGRPDLVRLAERPPDPPRELVGSAERLRGIGWRPSYDIRSGLAQTVQWWRMLQSSAGT